MSRLHGIDVTLYEQTVTGSDEFGADVYAETPVTVQNVIVGQPSEQDIINELRLSGKRAVYTLGIPKGDTHDWKDKKVSFFDETFKTFGYPIQGIEDMVPLEWNKKVMVERYE